jgi:RND family efflux transporter MFP subunit
MKALLHLTLVTALVGGLAGCGKKAQSEQPATQQATDTVAVKVLAVQPEAQAAPVVASGQFTTDDATLLGFKIGGVIEKIFVEENQTVAPGQLLATLNLTEIQAGVRQAELGLEKAERDLKRATGLYKDSVVTLEQLQNAQTGVDVAKKQLEAAAFNKQYAEIRTVRGGVVVKKLANAGQVVGPGTPVLQTIGTSKGHWRLRVGVSDKDWAHIAVGNKATLATDIPGLESITAHVSSKADAADPQNGTFSIEITPDAQPSQLANGMFGKATIYTQGGAGLVQVPYAALLDGDKGDAYLYVTTDGKTAQRRKVTIAAIERDQALVSSGLQAGDKVIVSGSPYLSDGSAIKVQ